MSDLDDAVISALDATWNKIQKLEPRVPDAIWYLTSGRSSSCATGPWGSSGELVLRINLKREGRNRDGEDLLGQLVHWAAHAATGLSSGAEARYHSRQFGEIAARLGLEITRPKGLGYTPKLDARGAEALSPVAISKFRAEIRALGKAMADWQPVAEEAPRKKTRGPLLMTCKCDPPRWVRTAKGIALDGDITCGRCSQVFTIKPGQLD